MNKSTAWVLKNSFLVIILIVLGKVVSFGRDLLISARYGVSSSTDAYFAANSIPSILFIAWVTSALMFFIPTYTEILVGEGEGRANEFASNTINIAVVFSLGLVIVGVGFSHQLVRIVAPGFSGETFELAVALTKILCLSFPVSFATLLFSAIANARQMHYGPQLVPVVNGFAVIFGIYFFSTRYGIHALAASSVAAFAISLVIQRLAIRKVYHHQWVFKLNDPGLVKLLVLATPVFLGFMVDQINLFVDSVICSNQALGSLSHLNYAQRLQNTINGIFATGILTVAYPIMSRLATGEDRSQLAAFHGKCLRAVTYLLVPITLLIVLDSYSVVKIVFFRGKFNEIALGETSSIFMWYAVSVIFLAARDIHSRFFYILKDAKTPAIIGGLAVAFKTALSFLFVKWWGVPGLAIATSSSCILSAFLLSYWLGRKNDKFKAVHFKRADYFALAIATLAMAGVHSALHWLTPGFKVLPQLMLSAAISTLIYLLILWLFRIDEIVHLSEMVFDALSRRQGSK